MNRLAVAAAAVAGAAVMALGAWLGIGAFSASPFSFQAAYDTAASGAVISVPAGTPAFDDAGRSSATVFADQPGASNKAITFACADPAGLVSFAAGQRLTIKAYNVTLRGDCFRLRDLAIGEGGDSTRQAGNVLVEGVHMEGAEVVGSEATIRNSEIGPGVFCWPQGKTGQGGNGGTITPAMWCDPNGPAYEAAYATRGSTDQNFQVYFHNNSGGALAALTLEGNNIHDLNTKDAFNLHPDCILGWQPSAAQPVVIRNNRIERCGVLGVQISETDGIVYEGNWHGPPVEPFSNTLNASCLRINLACALVETDSAQKELIFEEGAASDWLVKSNTFCHGTRLGSSGSGAPGTRFESNDLGLADNPWPGATYVRNTNIGASCSGGTPPPPVLAQCSDGVDNDADALIDLADPGCATALDNDETNVAPPPPPLSCVAPALSAGPQTDTTSTLTWAAISGATGFRFYRNGSLVATAGSLATSYRFRSLSYGTSRLGVAALCPEEKLSTVSSIETRVLGSPG